jgi:hypothetical protein
MPALRIWKIGTLIGTVLLVIGISAGYIDIATHFAVSLLSSNVFPLSILVGLLLVFACLIGWATHVTRAVRLRLALLVFVAPWLGLAVGYPFAGSNIHGPAVFLMYVVGPASILLALVLLIMAVAARHII